VARCVEEDMCYDTTIEFYFHKHTFVQRDDCGAARKSEKCQFLIATDIYKVAPQQLSRCAAKDAEFTRNVANAHQA